MNFVDNVLGHCRLCTRKDEVQDMVACDQCDRWFHYGCVELTCLPDKKEPWSCAKCRMDESIKKAQADELIQMKNKLANIALELEARAKAQKSSEIHATSMETELAHYKRELESKHKEEKDKRDVLLDIAQAIQLNKVKLENELVRKETAADDDSVAMYLKRQEMSLPQFSGNAREWPAFKKMFEATTEQGKYTSLENLIRLQKALGGPAAKAVQSMMLDQANVPQIMERLEKQFGQSKRVYKELRDDLERIRTGGHLAIVEISNGLENLIAHLTASNQMAYSNDPRLVEELVSKMSCDTQIKWLEVVESNAKQGNSVPSLKDLAKWLKPKADIHRELYNSNRAPIEKRNRVNVHSENNVRCYMCNGTHRLRECQKFGKMSVQNRRQEILKLRVCPLCLFRHKGNCNFQRNCGINGCNEHHHRLLHIPRDIHNQGSRPERRQITASGEPTEPRPETSNLHEEQRAQVFYQIIPVTLKNKNCEVETYAFLDPGSSLTLIDEGVAEELELEGVRDPLKIKWTQNVSREEKTSRRVKLKIKGNSDNEFTLTNVRTASNLHLPVQTVNYDNLADKYPFLANLPIKNYKNAQPKLLIGLNHSHLLYPLERRAMGVNEPIAIKTKLGWLIFGNIKHTAQAEHLMVIQEDDKMNDLMQRYFSVEDFGVKIPEKLPETKNEIRAKEIINKTLKYTGEKYEVGLLWKEDDTHLPESYIQAYKRLQNLEAKLKKDPELKNWTNNTIADYVTKGYARKLTPKEKEEWAGEIFYLPTFIVVNKNKTPPKPRLVFDAAAKSWGISLNDALLAGPDATTSLFGVTTNFREGAIASAGDVQEMFSQVGISLEDQKKQCFLYRDCDDSREPDVYVMQVMIFGSTSSPACAQAVKNYNASLYAETKPKAVKAIIKQHYVDDYIDSFDTPQEATQTIKDVMEIHDKAKFFIRNFVSNSKEVLASLPKNRVQVDKIKTFEDKESEGEKVLGMYWDTSKDCIQYQLKFNRLPVDVRHEIRKPTKREVLSFVMSVYDPMGLIANLTIHGRILIQELHKETSDWDAEISERSYNQWKQFLEIIKEAPKVCTKNRRETKPALQDKGKGQKAPPIKRKRKVVNQPVEIHRINHHREYEDGDIGPVSANRKRKVEGELPSANLTMDQRAGKNFNSWGKRCKVDIDKVKELRDRMNSKQKPRNVTNKTKIHVPWYMTIIMVLFFITAALGQYPTGLIAYDCASPEVNMTSYSLLDVTSCIPSTKNLSISEVPIQVLQRSSKGSTMVYQCKMIIKRSIRHCGMHSHTSDYERGYSYIVKEFTPDECRRTQLTGAIPLTLSAGLLELKRNHTTRGETLVVGSVWASSCSGGVYKTPEYTWINALVYFEYEIALYNYMATIDNENDQIMLRHGLVCPYSHGKCLDSEDGYSTWDVSLNQRCEDTDFEVIYEGKVNKTINIEGNKPNPHAVYTSISDSHLFSIRTKDTAKICRYKGYSTDHPRIFILEEAEFKSPFARRPSSARNHDIFTYFNSKITLVENYVGQKLDDVYNTVMTEMCKLDKALLETKLTLARINPTEFVNSIMKRTGFSAVVAGEVLHVLECKPVYVQPFASERCYQELPVKFGNVTMFLTPVTRTLQMRGTEIECTPLLPAKFQFGGRWYTFDGKIRETTFPQKLATDIVTKWTYTPLPNLMESGIYDADSLKKMRTMIYDQGDRRIATNVVHKILTGQNPSKQGFHFEALMSEKLIDNMINKYWEKLVSLSSWLGNITSTAIGLYIIGRIIKFLVDTLMHGRILYDIYGFGWQLIASLWDSMTTFLTHRNTLKNIKKSTTRTYDVTTPEDGTNPSENTPLSDEEPQTVARAHPPAHPYVALTMPR
ncbi:uncharacterized protein LOC135717136 [Ochlerotatus camptorhynchus]|uniref:uncharacterized protein LOC135717136 n=1 Tax=Ochlerotatus camptorhynchus TaxID=644619 RepID=UPI0031D2CD2A